MIPKRLFEYAGAGDFAASNVSAFKALHLQLMGMACEVPSARTSISAAQFFTWKMAKTALINLRKSGYQR
jgi:hypothetical protein